MRRWWPWAAAAGVVLAFVIGILAGRASRAPSARPSASALATALPTAVATAAPATAAPVVAGRVVDGALVIHGGGDVNLDPRQLGLLRSSYGAPWSGVRDLFRGDSLTVVNLECAGAEGGTAQEKEFTFRCLPAAMPAMREAGVEVANQGNNHAGDYGPQLVVPARANLKAAGVWPVGAGKDASEANAPALFTVGGKKIAVVGFGGVVPDPSWIATPTKPGVADGYDVDSMVRAVRAADEVADVVVVSIHWGAELDTEPRSDDIGRAEAMVHAGADVIFGHHAHRTQPLGWIGGRPVFYGLGNFVWPARGAGAITAIGEALVRPDGTYSACLLPATIRGGRPTLDRPYAGPCD
jgi:poly-gamma-glutamate capsule biosynthesis protein CapA/YwtB (metallophosphatase superfamily)